MTWRNLCWEDVAEGQQIPAGSRHLTVTDVIACAVASRDFTPLHYDRDCARSAGLKDIILNTPTLYGLSGKYLTDWAGPGAELKEISLQIMASCYPGDTLMTTGAVSSKRDEDGLHLVCVDIVFSVSGEVRARARALLALPTAGQEAVSNGRP